MGTAAHSQSINFYFSTFMIFFKVLLEHDLLLFIAHLNFIIPQSAVQRVGIIPVTEIQSNHCRRIVAKGIIRTENCPKRLKLRSSSLPRAHGLFETHCHTCWEHSPKYTHSLIIFMKREIGSRTSTLGTAGHQTAVIIMRTHVWHASLSLRV